MSIPPKYRDEPIPVRNVIEAWEMAVILGEGLNALFPLTLVVGRTIYWQPLVRRFVSLSQAG